MKQPAVPSALTISSSWGSRSTIINGSNNCFAAANDVSRPVQSLGWGWSYGVAAWPYCRTLSRATMFNAFNFSIGIFGNAGGTTRSSRATHTVGYIQLAALICPSDGTRLRPDRAMGLHQLHGQSRAGPVRALVVHRYDRSPGRKPPRHARPRTGFRVGVMPRTWVRLVLKTSVTARPIPACSVNDCWVLTVTPSSPAVRLISSEPSLTAQSDCRLSSRRRVRRPTWHLCRAVWRFPALHPLEVTSYGSGSLLGRIRYPWHQVDLHHVHCTTDRPTASNCQNPSDVLRHLADFTLVPPGSAPPSQQSPRWCEHGPCRWLGSGSSRTASGCRLWWASRHT